ncbi:hypothetical protein PN465_08610 [Nodularia spumigena CS-584]|uniref:hypothetical protein n=1 Tax=Nodularia spumigena TaxID=70799 RepID=UPI00232DE3B8|nr:hypothetical protein [Nodularia spumigena]MDB9382283.1 hypothetical protein [Nodularia spumigena CS-584]
MSNLENSDFIGLWKTREMIPNWVYGDNVEIIIYSYRSFSLRIDGEDTLLVEGTLTINNLENDSFELVIEGSALEAKYLNLQGRMYMSNGDVPPSFVLTIPDLGERFFVQTRK